MRPGLPGDAAMGRCLTGSMRQREGELSGEPARQKTHSQEKVVTEGPCRTDLAPNPETRHISKSLLEQRMEEGREGSEAITGKEK